MKYIRRGEEGVRASDPGPSENQATPKGDFSLIRGSGWGVQMSVVS